MQKIRGMWKQSFGLSNKSLKPVLGSLHLTP